MNLIDGLAATFLLIAILAVASGRVLSLVRLYSLHSIVLGITAAAVAALTNAGHIYIVAALTIALKGALIPWGLRYVIEKIGVHREVEPLVPLPVSLLICGVLTALSFYIVQPIVTGHDILETITKNSLPMSLAVIFIGFFMMIARKKAITQIIGLLIMENGLFMAAYAVAYGMPLIVELGVFFDILMAAIILGLLAFRINRTFDTVDTTILRRLHD
ncbi:MAG: hydrogenase [Euryarchaeota archaeon]|nr:hydrogenase [Euryarchaeota archaeon]